MSCAIDDSFSLRPGGQPDVILWNKLMLAMICFRNVIAQNLIARFVFNSHVRICDMLHLYSYFFDVKGELFDNLSFCEATDCCLYIVWCPFSKKYYIGMTIRGGGNPMERTF